MKSTGAISKEISSLYENEGNQPMDWRTVSAVDKAKNVIRLLEHDKPMNILEVGCGDGALLNELSKSKVCNNLYGLEITNSLVETVLNRKINDLKECQVFDGCVIPHEDKKFDLVILSHVVEHVEHPRLLIYEAMRVGKKIIFEVPLEDTTRLKNDFKLTPTGHINFYSRKIFRNLLQSCGLKIIGERVTNPSIEVYKFKGGFHRILKFYIRQILLLVFGIYATKVLTYHYAVYCSTDKG